MSTSPPKLPESTITRLTKPFSRFLHVQAAGGIVLLAATIIAMILANSSLGGHFQGFWNQEFHIGVAGLELRYPLWYWVNDGLMALFFFVIGLEIKRELVHGELQDRRNVVLPLMGALGGAAIPIGIFLLVYGQGPARDAWAVPMATDIAFVVGCIAILGSRVPPALKVFVLSLAIIDDILAVATIATFFSSGIKLAWLGGAVGGLAAIAMLNQIGVRRIGAYVMVGAWVWLATLKAGIHPTVAGALLGLMTPAGSWLTKGKLRHVVDESRPWLEDSNAETERREAAMTLSVAATESVSPLVRLEYGLHPWTSFVIIPIFALANAGVPLEGASLGGGSTMAIAIALVVGKPLGIVAGCVIASVLGLAKKPKSFSWPALVGAGSLSGIGFTMALFIASLSLDGAELSATKMGILLGSAISMIVGMGLLVATLPRAGATGNVAAPEGT